MEEFLRKIFLILIMVIGLGGCVIPIDPMPTPTLTGPRWQVVDVNDKFTDISAKMVTISELASPYFVMQRSMIFYPFVGLREGKLFVGIRSGGQFRMPTGTVQMRIDSNKAWEISPSETPLHFLPQQASTLLPIPQGEQIQENIQESMAKNMSPFTAATGDKAKAIIKEMLAGKKMIYRSVGFNQPASLDGECPLDESFHEAMRQIGITQDLLN